MAKRLLANNDVTFIIPNRGGQYIDVVIKNFQNTFSEYFNNIQFIVIEQCDNEPFKKGQLYNIANQFVNTKYIGLIDNDAYNINKFNPVEVYNNLNSPYIAFDKVSQIKLIEGGYTILKTDERLYGFGLFVFMKTIDFKNANGFSNLCFGWGSEDNILATRIDFMRYINSVGHIAHEKRNNLYPELSANNRKILYKQTKMIIDKKLDGYNQTTYSKVYDKSENNVRYIGVDNIGVCKNFAYMNELENINNIINNGSECSKYENGISICVTAYKSVGYIKRTLDSIKFQTYFLENNNWECLIGIDGCEETLEKCKSIMNEYNEHFRFFMMDSNKGTYVTTNTLMKIAKYKYLIRFDSDDVMPTNFIENLNWEIRDNEFIRLRFETLDIKHWQSNAYGCVLITKDLFERYGGYKPWICAADKELAIRMEQVAKCGFSKKAMYYRTIRNDSLQFSPETCMTSPIRLKYHEYIDTQSVNNLIIECVTNSYKEIKNEN